MAIDKTIIDDFIKAINSNIDNSGQSIPLYGTVQSVSDGVASVTLDISGQTTSATLQVDAQAGDRVIVDISNHSASVVSNVTSLPSGRTATDVTETLDTYKTSNDGVVEKLTKGKEDAEKAIEDIKKDLNDNYVTTTKFDETLDPETGSYTKEIAKTYQSKSGMDSYVEKSTFTSTLETFESNISGTYQTQNGMSEYAKSSDVEQDINKFKATVEEKYQTIEDAKTVSDRVTTVEETASGLTTTVGNYISSNDKRVSEDEAKIDVNAKNISSTVTQLNNLSVGGRNLIPISYVTLYSEKIDTYEFSRSMKTASEGYVQAKAVDNSEGKLEVGGTYTLSIDIKVNDYVSTVDLYVFDSKTKSTRHRSLSRSELTSEYQRFSYTFTIEENSDADWSNFNVRIDNNGLTSDGVTAGATATMYVRNMKLEKGNMATDWSPAPEDSDAQVSKLQSQIDQNAEKIGLKVSKTDLQYTGSNLLRYTGDLSQWHIYSSASATTDKNSITFAKQSTLAYYGFCSPRMLYSEVRDKTVTISCEVQIPDESMESGETIAVQGGLTASDSITSTRTVYNSFFSIPYTSITDNDWHRFYATVTLTDSWFKNNGTKADTDIYFYVQIYNHTRRKANIRNIQLEYGEIATAWSESPLDVVDKVTEEAAIDIMKDQISSIVISDDNGAITESKMVQTDTGFTWTINSSNLKGEQGDPGTSEYTYIRYSVNSDGTSFVETPTASTKYIGVYTGTSTTAPTTPASYKWSKYIGEDGATGKGISSITPHYALSTSNTSVTGTWSPNAQTMTSTNKYLWFYQTVTYTDDSTEDTTKTVIGVYGSLSPNLLRYTGDLSKWWASGVNGTISENTATFSARTTASYPFIGSPKILYSDVKDTTVTASFEVQVPTGTLDSGENVQMVFSLSSGSSLTTGRSKYRSAISLNNTKITDNEWHKWTGTIQITDSWFTSGTAGTNDIYFFVAVFDHTKLQVNVRNIQLEYGSTATDWNVSPLDVAAMTTDTKNAAKTATSFMSLNGYGTGLTIGDLTNGSLGQNAFIDTNGFHVRNASKQDLASLQASSVSLASGRCKIDYYTGNSTYGDSTVIRSEGPIILSSAYGAFIDGTSVMVTVPIDVNSKYVSSSFAEDFSYNTSFVELYVKGWAKVHIDLALPRTSTDMAKSTSYKVAAIGSLNGHSLAPLHRTALTYYGSSSASGGATPMACITDDGEIIIRQTGVASNPGTMYVSGTYIIPFTIDSLYTEDSVTITSGTLSGDTDTE